MSDKYTLVGQTAVRCDDLLTWAKEFETMERRVAYTRVLDLVDVSTVFLGLNHSWGDGPPLLYESMAFWRGGHGDELERCSTWMEAEAQHREMVRAVATWPFVLAYCRRMWSDYWRRARSAWSRDWRDFSGIEPSDTEELMDRMDEAFAKQDRWL